MLWRIRVGVSKDGESFLETSFSHSPITIGARPDNDVVLSDRYVSGRHAEVVVSRSRMVFRDRSTNGSFVGDRRIDGTESLGIGGVVSIPPFEIELSLEQDDEEWRTAHRRHLADLVPPRPEPPIDGSPDPGPPADPEAPWSGLEWSGHSSEDRGLAPGEDTVLLAGSESLPGPVLRLVEGGQPDFVEELTASEFPLAGGTLRLGRSQKADVRLPSRTVSRLHAAVSPSAGGSFVLRDLDSSNGTFVNGQRITEVELGDGDEILVGDVALRFCVPEAGAPPAAPPAERTVRGPAALEITVRPVAGTASPAVLVAIRGRVDGHHDTELADALGQAIDDGARFLVVDLTEVDYIAHSGLNVFFRCLKRLHKSGGDLMLAGLSRRLQDAFSLSRLDTVFRGRIAADPEEALGKWR
jgi:anti-anti-sigma factor